MFEIGNTLREARLRRGQDVAECELATKIRAKYLRAMEEEQFELLPSPAYVRGFLRTYSEYLGLDGQLVIDEYESRFGGLEPGEGDRRHRPRAGGGRRAGASTAPRGTRPNRRRTETQLLWLAIGGVMAVALLVWMGVGNPDEPAPSLTTTPAAASSPVTDEALATPEAPEALRITLTGLGAVGAFVEVRGRDANGRQVYAGLLKDGNSKVFTVEESLWVRTYNAEGLQVAVKGKKSTLSGGTADFLISRKGVVALETAGSANSAP